MKFPSENIEDTRDFRYTSTFESITFHDNRRIKLIMNKDILKVTQRRKIDLKFHYNCFFLFFFPNLNNEVRQ